MNLISPVNRDVFSVEDKSHVGHMMSVNQSVLDGTSKWSAKIAITGLFKSPLYITSAPTSCPSSTLVLSIIFASLWLLFFLFHFFSSSLHILVLLLFSTAFFHCLFLPVIVLRVVSSASRGDVDRVTVKTKWRSGACSFRFMFRCAAFNLHQNEPKRGF